VADRSFTAIGLASYKPPTSISTDDFTWTEGVETFDNLDPNVDYDRTFERNFYLGTPPAFNQSGNGTSSRYGSCALFFARVTDSVKFDSDNIETAVGTCNEALTTDCTNALLNQAKAAAGSFGDLSSDDACERLRSDFEDNLASQCPQFATGDKWQGLEVKGMTTSPLLTVTY
jgi:hypothetical protein